MNNRRRSRKIKQFNKSIGNLIIIVLSLLTLILVIFYFNYDSVAADNSTHRTKEFVSIKIEKGDTLWDIAGEYITDEYSDMNEYLEEIKTSNGICENVIHEGNYLIIPYYD